MSEPTTSDTTEIVRNNLIGLLIVGVLAASLAHATGGGSSILFGVWFLAQAAINLLLAVVQAVQGRPALGYFLSAVLVLLIGFGACAGMMSLTPLKL